MLKYLRKYWIFGLLAALGMAGEVMADIVQPAQMAHIVDDGILGIGRGGMTDLGLITSTGIRMILIVIGGALSGVFSGAMANICAQNYGNDLRKASFARIIHFSFEQTDKFTTGSLITRVTNDITQMENMVRQSVRGAVRCFMFLIVGTATLVRMNPHTGLIMACVVPLILLDIAFVLLRVTPLFGILQSRLDRMNSVMQEDVNGARVVKAFIQEDKEAERFGQSNKALVDTQFQTLVLIAFLRPVMNIILNLAAVAVIRIGAVDVQAGTLRPGEVMASITYLQLILQGLRMLAMIFQTMSRGFASAGRISEIHRTEPVLRDPEKDTAMLSGSEAGASMTSVPPAIAFDHVSFSYPSAHVRVLHDISFSLLPGETLAVIGATGCGKSTLVSLIDRFYDVTEGSVAVGGRDVRQYRLHDLRERIAFVPQKNELFSTTIRENILLGAGDAAASADPEIVARAAQDAQAEEFILKQPEGYDTPVAEGGMSLSGGQRQRIAISRALLKLRLRAAEVSLREAPDDGAAGPASILILDDSTSALDLITERRLHDALRRHYHDLTKVIIAQRIASVKDADHIAVMDRGRIVQYGTHAELAAVPGIYQEICRSQLGEQAAAEASVPGSGVPAPAAAAAEDSGDVQTERGGAENE